MRPWNRPQEVAELTATPVRGAVADPGPHDWRARRLLDSRPAWPVTGSHDWPLERPPRLSLRSRYRSATGYLVVLFKDGAEAQRALRGLVERGVPEVDLRLYLSEEILSIASRQRHDRPALARAIAALTADRAARRRYVDNAKTGGAALWFFAPIHRRADSLVRLLADYDYLSLRYFSQEGVQDIDRYAA
jgi:hypothetical protein